MPGSDTGHSPEQANPSIVDQRLYAFDQSWQNGAVPNIRDYFPLNATDCGNQAGRDYLAELVKIDLEYRWRRKPATGNPWALEEYVAQFPELGAVHELPIDLIAAEYLARRQQGADASHAAYCARFPGREGEMRAALARMDVTFAREIEPERFPRAGRDRQDRSPTPPPVQSAADLVTLLEDLALLDAAPCAQLGELKQAFSEARALAKELLQRGWLTPYQVNQLLTGRGADLTIGRYVVLERLGEGGSGQVYKARDRTMKRIVALKLIRPELLSEPEVLGRFYREIRVISQLTHPNIIHAFDAGPLGAGHCLIMEYIPGINLDQLVKQSGPLPVAQVGDYLVQAAGALQCIHEKGLVHRDIKPSNLLATQAAGGPPLGLLKLLDLGLARLRRVRNVGDNTSIITPVGAVIGTPNYLAPEQAIDFHSADIRADIYSLGCTVYFLLTGQPPFPGGSAAEKVAKHLYVDPQPAEQLRPDLPPSLGMVLRRMMAKRPEDRFPTPAELVPALAAAGPGAATTPGSQQPLADTRASPTITSPAPLAHSPRSTSSDQTRPLGPKPPVIPVGVAESPLSAAPGSYPQVAPPDARRPLGRRRLLWFAASSVLGLGALGAFLVRLLQSAGTLTSPTLAKGTHGSAPTSSAVAQTRVNLSSAFNHVYIVTDGAPFPSTWGEGGFTKYALSAHLLDTQVTWNGTTFNLGAANGNNVVIAAGQTLSLPAGNYATLKILAFAWGNHLNQDFKVTYTDGTTQNFSQSLSSWAKPQNYAGELTAVTMTYHNSSNGAIVNSPTYVYGYSLALNPAKTLRSITLPNNSLIKLVAITLA